MEKFSGKEKIALAVFGLILIAVIIQVVVNFTTSAPPPIRGKRVEEENPDLAGNLLARPGVTLDASSHNKTGEVVEKLRDGQAASIWHVAGNLIGFQAWVLIDFGEGRIKTVRSLMAKPRSDIPHQFFRSAELQGSNDGEHWELVAGLLQREPPMDAHWIRWDFENNSAFRYYRLVIADGHELNKFYSMAELALLE